MVQTPGTADMKDCVKGILFVPRHHLIVLLFWFYYLRENHCVQSGSLPV